MTGRSMTRRSTPRSDLPRRIELPSITVWLIVTVLLALFISGFSGANISVQRLGTGVINLGILFNEAFPPDLRRLSLISASMLETLQMAVVGVVFGVLLSFPMALLCARNTNSHGVIRLLAHNVVATLRTVPDLVWALIFVVTVGLGPLAGILTIVIDTIGFCGRFFAERIEEVDPGPGEALAATGATPAAVIFGAVVPECFPSFVATSLFSVEKAVRSAVVLGLVGAGGIGMELSASMSLFRYDQALTVILVILAVVISVEQVSSWIRKRVI